LANRLMFKIRVPVCDSVSLLLHRHAPVFLDRPKWIVGDLPCMSVRIGKKPGVSAPEDFLRLLYDGCTIVFQSSKNCVDFLFASDIVSEGVTSVGWDVIARHTQV